MPDEFHRLAENRCDGVEGVVIAVRPGENDHSKFHVAVAPCGNLATLILAYARVFSVETHSKLRKLNHSERPPDDPELAGCRVDSMASEDAYKNEAQRRRADFRGRDLRRAPDFARRDFLGFSAAASSRRRLAAQLGLLAWRPRAMASASAGTFSVMTEPAAT